MSKGLVDYGKRQRVGAGHREAALAAGDSVVAEHVGRKNWPLWWRATPRG